MSRDKIEKKEKKNEINALEILTMSSKVSSRNFESTEFSVIKGR